MLTRAATELVVTFGSVGHVYQPTLISRWLPYLTHALLFVVCLSWSLQIAVTSVTAFHFAQLWSTVYHFWIRHARQ